MSSPLVNGVLIILESKSTYNSAKGTLVLSVDKIRTCNNNYDLFHGKNMCAIPITNRIFTNTSFIFLNNLFA